MEFILGLGVLVFATLLFILFSWFWNKIKPQNNSLQTERAERCLCPTCSADLNEKIFNQIKRNPGANKATTRCGCGTTSDWNVTGSPFILLGHRGRKN